MRLLITTLALGQCAVVGVGAAGVATAAPTTTWVIERAEAQSGESAGVAAASACGRLPGVVSYVDLFSEPGVIHVEVEGAAHARSVERCLNKLDGFAGAAVVTVRRGGVTAFGRG